MSNFDRGRLAKAASAWLDALRKRGVDVPDSPVNILGALDALGALKEPDWSKIGANYEYHDRDS